MDVLVHFQTPGFGFVEGKFLLLFGFQKRPLSKVTVNHPSAKQQITSVFLNHTCPLWKLKRIHLGKQGGTAPRSVGKRLFLFLIFLIVK